jgi:carnosine N-methyltransferase
VHDHSHPPGHSHELAHEHSHGSPLHPPAGQKNSRRRRRPTDFDMDKVRSTLKQLVRDWSEEVSATPSSHDEYSSKTTILQTLRERKKGRRLTSRLRKRYSTTSRISPWRKGMENPISWRASSQTKSRHNFRVLVPGAGLGRLAYDVAKLGRFLTLLFHFCDRFSVRLFVSGKRVFTLHAARLVLYS